MGSLWLAAVAVEEVRALFGASEPEAAALRALAAERFGRHGEPAAGLLGKLGPVFRRAPDAPVIRPDTPLREDCDRLLGGQHVPPHRLAASWRLLQVWVEARSWSTHTCEVDEHALNAIEFDLARAGVPARASVRGLLVRDLETGLFPAPGMVAGYSSSDHVAEAAAAWRAVLDDLEPATAAWIGDLLGWLDGFGEWTAAAAASRRPLPDLVCVLTA